MPGVEMVIIALDRDNCALVVYVVVLGSFRKQCSMCQLLLAFKGCLGVFIKD